jgi:hypothetical protein
MKSSLNAVPDTTPTAGSRLDALERRVALLEKQAGLRLLDTCRLCGKRATVRTHVHPGEGGHVVEWWDCTSCKERDIRVHLNWPDAPI